LALVEELALTVQRLPLEACCLSLVDTTVSVLAVTVQARRALADTVLRARHLALMVMPHSLVAMVQERLSTAMSPASMRAVVEVADTTALLILTLVVLAVAVVMALVALRLLVEQRVVRV
jgi:hypothetical protein